MSIIAAGSETYVELVPDFDAPEDVESGPILTWLDLPRAYGENGYNTHLRVGDEAVLRLIYPNIRINYLGDGQFRVRLPRPKMAS